MCMRTYSNNLISALNLHKLKINEFLLEILDYITREDQTTTRHHYRAS